MKDKDEYIYTTNEPEEDLEEEYLDENGEFDLDAYFGNATTEDEEDEYDIYNEPESEMAPSSPKGMIAFYTNKANKKHKLNDMPGPLRAQILKMFVIAVLIEAAGIAMGIVFSNREYIIFGSILAVVCLIFALRFYILGAYQQYIYHVGRVTVSDFYKNQQQYYRTAVKRTLKVDINCRDFTMEKEDGLKLTVTCKSSKDLPEEDDLVALLCWKSTNFEFYHSERHVKTRNYISIEKIG